MSRKRVKANWLFTPSNARAFRPVGGEVELTVVDPRVDVPTFDGGLVYNGSALTPSFTGYDTTAMTIGGITSATEVGQYAAVFTLVDGYLWTDGTSDPRTVIWNIDKITINDIPRQSGRLEYTSTSLLPTWNNYDINALDLEINSETNVGTYDAKFTPTQNYKWADGTSDPKTIQWTISKITPVLNIVVPSNHEYGTPLSSIRPTVSSTISGTFSWVTSDADFDNMMSPATAEYKWVPDDTSIYEEVTGSIAVLIDEVDIEGIPSVNVTMYYDGTVQTPVWNNFDPNKLVISGDTSATNVGTYKTIFTPTAKYEWDDGTKDPKEVEWKIEAAIVPVPAISSDPVLQYTGSQVELCQVPSSVVVNGDICGTEIGVYNCTFCLCDKNNYIWDNNTTDDISVTWEISDQVGLVPDADVSLTTNVEYGDKLSETPINGTATYNTRPVSGNFGWTTTDDEFAAAVESAYASNPDITTCTSPTILNNLVYDGNVQTPNWVNFNPIKMSISGDTSATDAGEYTAIFTLVPGYTWLDGSTDPREAKWVIEPMNIDTVPSTMDLSYAINDQTPVWNDYDPIKLTISGDVSGKNAGTYTAIFTPTANYQWADGTKDPIEVQWMINKVNPTYNMAGSIVYKVPLSNMQEGTHTATFSISDGNNVISEDIPGTIAFNTTDAEWAKYDAGQTYYPTLVFTPDDQTNYSPITITAVITLLEITIDNPPTQTNVRQYTGYTVYPSWDGYDTEQLTISGQTSGKDAGNYKVTFTPKKNYKWADGTYDPKEVIWVIEAMFIVIPIPVILVAYTGSAVSPEWNNYDPEKLTISGDVSATNVGIYKAIFTPTANYQWEDGTRSPKEVEWEIANATPFTITKDNKSELGLSGSDVVVPATFIGSDGVFYKVTAIADVANQGDGAFSRTYYRSVTLPDTLVRIGDHAFDYNTNLTTINFGNGLQEIGEYAFYACKALTNATLPDTVTSIGNNAFDSCGVLETVDLGEGITIIPEGLFTACFKLILVIIGSKVTRIEKQAFYYTQLLPTVELPDTLEYIGEEAFLNSGITHITIPDKVTTICEHTFGGCDKMVTCNIPNTVRTIEAFAFMGCESLATINIPEGITSLPDQSIFSRCTSLNNITLPSTLKEIGWGTFDGCSSLTSINLINNLKLGDYAFSDCGLTSLTIPGTITEMGEQVFARCPNLKTVTVLDGYAKIGQLAFKDCTGLTTLTINSKMDTIGKSAFFGCSVLKTIKINTGVNVIDNSAFYQCPAITEVTIPAYNTIIGPGAFCECTGITKVTINSGVTIGHRAFEDCTKLYTLTLNEGAVSIGDYAFAGCTRLPKVTIPASIEMMGKGAFAGCTAMTSATITHGNALKRFDDYNGDYSYNGDTFYGCTKLSKVNLPTTINGEMPPMMFYGCKVLNNVVLPSGITYVPASMFTGCTALTTITIPNTVTFIGDSSFSDSGIKVPVIPSSVTKIGRRAFASSKVTNVNIPTGVTNIGYLAFFDCTNFNTLTLPATLTTMENWDQSPYYPIIMNCSNLKTINYRGTQAQWNSLMASHSYFKNLVSSYGTTVNYNYAG